MLPYEVVVENGVLVRVKTEGCYKDGTFCMYRDVTSIADSARYDLREITPCKIMVENGGAFVSDGRCILSRTGGNLYLGFNDSMIPPRTKVIKRGAFAYSGNNRHLLIPSHVSRVESFAFANNVGGLSRYYFEGSPELGECVFGTKKEKELASGKLPEFEGMPYTDNKNFVVLAKPGSSVEEYCKKYGIKFEAVKD